MADIKIGVSPAHAEIWAKELLSDGYCIIRDLVQPDLVIRFEEDLGECFLNTPFCEGGFYGPRTKRFGGLLKRSSVAAHFVQHPLILAIANKVLGAWCDCYNLNLTQAIEIYPGAPAQYPHRDQDMWQGPKGKMQYLLNVIWPLSDFTAVNGATMIWPGSHGPDEFDEPPVGDPVIAEMVPGEALLFLGSTLHGAGANNAKAVRRGVIVSYCLGWLKPFENQWLCYPPDIARRFDPDLANLAGYSLHRPNLGNYEGQSPSILLNGDVPKYIAASDALRPDQAEALKLFTAGQAVIKGHPENSSDV
jgi:hypothetical protein